MRMRMVIAVLMSLVVLCGCESLLGSKTETPTAKQEKANKLADQAAAGSVAQRGRLEEATKPPVDVRECLVHDCTPSEDAVGLPPRMRANLAAKGEIVLLSFTVDAEKLPHDRVEAYKLVSGRETEVLGVESCLDSCPRLYRLERRRSEFPDDSKLGIRIFNGRDLVWEIQACITPLNMKIEFSWAVAVPPKDVKEAGAKSEAAETGATVAVAAKVETPPNPTTTPPAGTGWFKPTQFGVVQEVEFFYGHLEREKFSTLEGVIQDVKNKKKTEVYVLPLGKDGMIYGLEVPIKDLPVPSWISLIGRPKDGGPPLFAIYYYDGKGLTLSINGPYQKK